jgi:PAS domain S-box-containing protein
MNDKQLKQLRKQAEQLLAQHGINHGDEFIDSVERLLEELSIHRIELELQNQELQQANVRLEAERSKFRSLYMDAPVAYFTLNYTGNIIELNNAAAELLQLPIHTFKYTSIFPYIAPESKIKFVKQFKALFDSDSKNYGEINFINPNGEFIFTKLMAVCYYDNELKQRLCRCTVTDITEIKHYQNEIAMEERLRQVADNLEDVFWLRSADNKEMLYINPAYERIWAQSVQKIYTNPNSFIDSIHPEDRTKALQTMQQHDHSQQLKMEYRIISGNGSIKWIQARSFPIKNAQGEIVAHTGIATDITERVQIEQIIERNAAELEQILATTPDGFFMLDAKGNFLKANAAFCQAHGYSEAELLQLTIADIVASETIEQTKAHIQKIHQQGYDCFESLHRTKSGALLNLDISVSSSRSGEMKMFVFARDITARKQAEQQLKYQAGLIKSLLDSIPDLIFYKDINGVYLGCNPAFAEFIDLDCVAVVGKTDYELFAPKVAQDFRFHDNKMLARLTARRNEEWVTYSDGRQILLETLKTPYFDVEGQLIGILGISRDITARKQAEERFKLASESSSDLIFEYDIKIGALNWFGDVDELLGYAPGEFARTIEAWNSLIHPGDRELVDKFFTTAIEQGGKHYAEYRIIDRNGKIKHWTDSGTVVKDQYGQAIKWIGVICDITERKQAEEKLKNYQATLELMINIAKNFINVPLEQLDMEFNQALKTVAEFVKADRAYIFSYDFTAQTCSNTHEWCAPDVSSHLAELQQVPLNTLDGWIEQHRKNEAIYVQNVSTLPENSSMRQHLIKQNIKSLIAIPLINKEEITGFVGFDFVNGYYNFTGIEEDVLVVLAELIVNVNSRFASLNALQTAKYTAEQASKAKSEFLANTSHEIRTPLNAIMGLSKLSLEQEIDPQQRDSLEKIYRSSKMLLGIINDILDFSKIEAGKLELEQHSFYLNEIAEHVQTLFATAAVQKGLKLKLNLAPELEMAFIGDSLRLGQILTNLIGNALKFTERGMVELRISPIKQEPNAIELKFEIIDTGVGISTSNANKLFQAFSQADTSITRKFGGTGLGLVISARLVEAMGGKLSFTSSLGRGSNFYFTIQLPISKQAVAHKNTNNTLIPLLGDYVILLVEDNQINQEIAYRWLEKTQANIIVAENGQIAIEKLQQRKVDLVLMDIQMPIMDGYTASKLIIQQWPKLPIIALSAAVLEEDRRKAQEAGMQAHLKKPLDEKELFATIAYWLKPKMIIENLPIKQPIFEYDLANFVIADGMRVACGDAKFYLKQLHRFKKELDSDLGNIVTIAKTGDLSATVALAHALKGVAAALGANKLAAVAARLDAVCRTNNNPSMQLLDELQELISITKQELTKLPNPNIELVNCDISSKTAETTLLELINLISRNEFVDDIKLYVVIQYIAQELGAEIAEELKEQIENFDYSHALPKLKNLASSLTRK